MILFTFSCQSPTRENATVTGVNPPAEGFNSAGSDAKAIEIADQVMLAMGGRKAWDDTRVIGWNFNGRRYLIWDKQTGDVRIDVPQDTAVYLLNVDGGNLKVKMKGEEITDNDSLKALYKRGESMWINDSYWLVMPFKLKDSGVTLKYIGEDTTQAGVPSEVLQLTFQNVGNTPDNMYQVWVDQSDNLIKQWSYYAKFDQEKPPAIWPWDNYQTFGSIKLSADRSDDRGPKFVQVLDSISSTVFASFDQPSMVKF
ncbi:MAG: hypothetical protein IPL46_11870 [Saprospiraceae bacterium]|nr:hypothetical protein [Saprospiraceae bacterium]